MGSLRRDLKRLAGQGLLLALASHGSDTRDPDAHLQREPFSYFLSAPEDYVNRLRKLSARNRSLARESGLPWFVSTPDLLLDAPEAVWLPLTVEVSSWKLKREAFSSRQVRFLHVPSRRVPAIKGTDFIEPVLHSLDIQGLLTYSAPQRVNHSQMRELVEHSDVVIDQLLTGSYGVSSRGGDGGWAARHRTRVCRDAPTDGRTSANSRGFSRIAQRRSDRRHLPTRALHLDGRLRTGLRRAVA